MDIQDLKDQFKDQFGQFKNQLQESPSFNAIKEKYEALPSKVQKLTIFGSLGLFLFLILSIPMSFLSTSSDNIEEFERNRSLIKRLLKTKEAKNLPAMPNIETSVLKNKIDSLLKRSNLLEEQIDDIKEVSNPSAFISKKVQQSGLDIFLKNLNLRQIVKIGYDLQTINQNAKLTGLNINASNKKNYFNVVFSLKNINFPEVSLPSFGKNDDKPKRRKRRGK